MIPKIYIPTCDSNLWLLKPLGYLFDKYWTEDTSVNILGFTKPSFNLSDKFIFNSMAESQEGGASRWTRYLYDFFCSCKEEYVIFSLEDFFPIDYPNFNLINELLDYMKNNNVGRADLTWDTFMVGDFSIINSYENCAMIKANKNAMYRISTQPAIWKLEYLLKFLDNDWSPWNFEVDGSELSFKMEEQVIAIADANFINFPSKWIHKGAHSRFHNDKINVLGINISTIKEMVEKGFFIEDKMQWGQWNGYVPTFKELGGYNFHPSMLPRHPSSQTYWREYYPIYNKGNLI